MLQNIEYNGHKLQAIEFTGETSVDLMDTVYGTAFMDTSETDYDCTTLFLYNKRNHPRPIRRGDYVMRTNGGKIFSCGWRTFRRMYAGAVRLLEVA